MFAKLEEVERRFDELTRTLEDPAIYGDSDKLQRVGRERKGIEEIVATFREYRKVEQRLSFVECAAILEYDGQVLQYAGGQVLISDGSGDFQGFAVRGLGLFQAAGPVVDDAERHQRLRERLAGAKRSLFSHQLVQ